MIIQVQQQPPPPTNAPSSDNNVKVGEPFIVSWDSTIRATLPTQVVHNYMCVVP